MNQQALLRHDILSKQELLDLILEYQTALDNSREKQKALDSIIRHNYKLVFGIASKIYNRRPLRTLELQDLVNAGLEGVIKAANCFDLSTGNSFSTPASWWIMSYINRTIEKEDRLIRLPSHMIYDLSKMKKTSAKFKSEHGRYPSVRELPNLLGLSQEKVESLMNAMRRSAISLDRKVSSTTGNDTTDLIEMIASSNEELDIYYQSELSQLLLETLNILTEREREAVILKHGLLDRNSRSLNAVSFELGITREGVRQCLSRAYRKLRSHKKSELFELFSLYVA